VSLELGEVLWEPDRDRVQAARLTEFARVVQDKHGVRFDDYETLWRWSVEHLEEFWSEVWDFFDVGAGSGHGPVLPDRRMPGARWFPGTHVSFVEHVLRQASGREDEAALVAVPEHGPSRVTTWRQLADQVGAVAAALTRLGVHEGDRVVAYLPNVPEAVIAFLATASIGAVWSTCGPDIGRRSATDRFGQLDPVLLFAADGYRFGGRTYDRRAAAQELADSLPSLRHVVTVPVLGLADGADGLRWDELLAEPERRSPEHFPFDHPLWVVYSSGTTGLPKGLVHGHGGVLLMALVQGALHGDQRSGDRAMSYTSTTWIMWNAVVCSLLNAVTAVLYDGNPMHPSVDRLWQLAEEHRLTAVGCSPGYLRACHKEGLSPSRDHDLPSLRSVGVTGSPVPAATYRWATQALGPRVHFRVFSGGTDFFANVVDTAPWLPVFTGEMSGRALGCHVEAWDPEGHPLVDEVGELVLVAPLPSMPLAIWGDTDGSRYRSTYFDTYPGVWRHGDWLTITRRGSAVISGRSDATLNRHGVRMGSADIYQAVEMLPEITEALVLGIEEPDGGYWLPLFVRLAPGRALDDALIARVKDAVREHASPRHVPDDVLGVRAIPHTPTGKKLEIPIKRIVQGASVPPAGDLGAVDDPEALRELVEVALRRQAERARRRPPSQIGRITAARPPSG
jgi:acetoacetyl-CoA synthetase